VAPGEFASEDLVRSLIRVIDQFLIRKERQLNELTFIHLTHPNSHELAQNYPNPFNPSTSIRFHLPIQSIIRLSIYYLLGQEITALIDGTLDAGLHSVDWKQFR
jgi:hypothetical protein